MDRETIAFVGIAIFLGLWMVLKKHGPEWKRKLVDCPEMPLRFEGERCASAEWRFTQ